MIGGGGHQKGKTNELNGKVNRETHQKKKAK